MPSLRMFTSPHHTAHHPPLEFLHGHHIPYYEAPRRIDALTEALTAEGIAQPEEPPLTLTRAGIEQAHAPEMVAWLEALAGDVRTEVAAELAIYDRQSLASDDDYYYESVFPPRRYRAGAPAGGRRFYIYDSVSPVGAGTWQAVVQAANLAHAGALALLGGERMAYAVCRPPGHHAGRDFMGGYCYLNNAAIAAYALLERGTVAVLDIDYHHGNGTQDIFWDEPRVLVASLHADPLVDYPYYCGYADETGGAPAPGTTLNLPLPHGTDERLYLATLSRALDAIRAYAPASLVVSLGLDTYAGDPMAKFTLERDSYSAIGRAIAALNLPTLVVQEGGYAVEALGGLAVAFFRGALGETSF